MNKYVKIILTVFLFAVFMAGAVLLYNRLSENYAPKEIEKTENEISEQEKNPDPEAAQEQESQEEATEDERIPAVDFTFSDRNGKTVKLSDYYGKPIVINFWATWCGPCKMEMPNFDNAYKKYGDKVEFIMLNMTDGDRDTPEKVEEFLSDKDYSFPVYLDTSLEGAYAYGAYSIPLSVFITADGFVHGGQYGMLPESTLENYISGILE